MVTFQVLRNAGLYCTILRILVKFMVANGISGTLYYRVILCLCGLGSVVGIATACGLDGPGIKSRWSEIYCTSPDRP